MAAIRAEKAGKVVVAENRRRIAESTSAEDRRGRTAAPSDEAEFATTGISLRLDEELRRLQVSRLDAIDRALEAMAERNDGVCAGCSSWIAIERLREAPDSRVRADCARKSAPLA